MIRKDFVFSGPYPTYILPSTQKSSPEHHTRIFVALMYRHSI